MSLSLNYPTIRPSLLLDFADAGALDPRITFVRATTARYYNGETYSLAEQNLFLQSQDFTTSWTKGATTITAAAATAPDGTTTAQKVIATVADSYHTMYQLVTTVPDSYTFSIYAKSAEYTKLYLSDPNTTRFVAAIDLATGLVISSSGSILVSATATRDATTGWVRCVLQLAVTSANIYCSAVGYPDSGATLTGFGAIYTGDAVSGVYLWGAQLERRNTATFYTTTTTLPITNYIPVLLTASAGQARFDYDPTTGLALGLLIEEARTNLLLQSQFASGWTVSNAVLQINQTIAPDGTQTAAKPYIIPPASYGGGSVLQSVAKSATATTYTYSVYSKIGELNRIALYINDTATINNRAQVTFNLTDGSVAGAATAVGTFTAASASAGTPMGNGWYRFALTFTSSTETSITARIYPTDSVLVTTNSYSGIYIWGAQLEAGGFATSYIATTSTALPRDADQFSLTGANFTSWYNTAAGTYFVAYKTVSTVINPTTSQLALIHDSSSTKRLLYISAGATAAQAYDGTSIIAVPGSLGVSTMYAISMDGNITSICANGGGINTATFNTAFRQATSVSNATTTSMWYSKIAYYPTQMTNAQLQNLTK